MSGERPPRSSLRHDLRTPLNQILGYTEMLQEEAEEGGGERFLPDLRRVHSAARTLLALVDRIPDATIPVAPPAEAPAPAAEETVPAREGDTPPMPPCEDDAADRGLPPAAKDGLGEGTLLVVDDNEMNRDMLSRRLRSRGYSVITADSGQQALDLMAAHAFDLVLLDVMMPGLSGLDVLRIVRETRSVADLPVIMATARDQGEDIAFALRLGANDYVTKPLDFPVVLARTEGQLALKRATEEVRRLARALEARNRFIQRAFGRYLSDEVVAGLLETPEGLRLGGEKREVTLLMADLRGFSATADRYAPEQVVKLLNTYLGAMTDVLSRYQGTIDEFLGDAIFALFGAPVVRADDAERGAACAVAMQLAMEEVNRKNQDAGLPAFEMGIAVHTGAVIVGNLGSESRAKYGVVGSHVNLVGRLESFTVGGQVLVSEANRARAGSSLETGERISFAAKGFRDPVVAYDLTGVGGHHGLRLPERPDELRALTPPLPVEVSVLDGKRLTDARFPADLVAASLRSAEMRAAAEVGPLHNVMLRFPDGQGGTLPGDLYAKVSGVASSAGNLRLRFTSADPEATEVLKRALSTSAP